MILLTSSDNEEFRAEKDVIMRIALVRSMIPEDEEHIVIPLPNVNGAILKKVLEFCERHRMDPLPDESQDTATTRRRTSDLSEWDKAFFAVGQETLFAVITAANYLDIKDLVDAGCNAVANLTKGMTPGEIQNLFNRP